VTLLSQKSTRRAKGGVKTRHASLTLEEEVQDFKLRQIVYERDLSATSETPWQFCQCKTE